MGKGGIIIPFIGGIIIPVKQKGGIIMGFQAQGGAT